MTPPRLARRLSTITAAGAAAVLLSGCYGITAQVGSQHDLIGDLDVTTSLCLTGNYGTAQVDGSGCVTGDAAAAGLPVQVFVSYLVPDEVADPVVGGATGTFADAGFVKLPASDTATLTNGVAQEGMRWVSFGSTHPIASAVSGQALTSSLTASFDPQSVPGGVLKVRTATAFRWLTDGEQHTDFTADRPIVCGLPIDLDSPVVPVGGIELASSPGLPLTPATSCNFATWPKSVDVIVPNELTVQSVSATDAPAPTFISYPVSQLALTAPLATEGAASASVTAGETAHLTFGQTSRLADGAVANSVALAASSSIPGAAPEAPAALTLGSETSVPVTVTVPKGTPTGDYVVELEGSYGSASREAKAVVHVTGLPATPAPAATPTPSPAAAPALTVPQKLAAGADDLSTALATEKRSDALRAGKVVLPVAFPTSGTVRVSVVLPAKGKRKAVTLAVGTGVSTASGVKTVAIKRTADGRKLLASGKPIQAQLIVRLWNPTGKIVAAPVPFTIAGASDEG